MKVIKITATWCSACIIMNKRWKEIEKDHDIDIISYDVDFDEDEVKKYNLGDGDRLPIALIIDGDKEIKRLVGEHSIDELKEFIKELVD